MVGVQDLVQPGTEQVIMTRRCAAGLHRSLHQAEKPVRYCNELERIGPNLANLDRLSTAFLLEKPERAGFFRDDYVQTMRDQHKRKSSFVGMLDEV